MNALNLIGGAIGLYRVVPPNEAHIRVMYDKKDVFMSRGNNRPSYWVTPFVTKIQKMPLTNIRIDVPDVKLNDIDMAKFMCDVVCFVNISDPILAAERTEITMEGVRYEDRIKKISDDLRAIMESIGRTVATKQTILQIYMDRNKLDDAVTAECQKVFPSWGMQLVDLEIKDLKDVDGSTVISDIERKKAAEITADARVKVATESRRAAIVEAEAQRDAELARATADETWKKRGLARDMAIAVSQQEVNAKLVESKRTLDVGIADIEKQKIEKQAEANKQRMTIEANGEAAKVQAIGSAEAEIIKKKKVADAEGTEKLALAQQKFNEAATSIEMIKANKEVQLKYADAYGQALSKANISVVTSGTQQLFDGGIIGKIPVGAEMGVAIKQLMDGLGPEKSAEIMKVLGDKLPPALKPK